MTGLTLSRYVGGGIECSLAPLLPRAATAAKTEPSVAVDPSLSEDGAKAAPGDDGNNAASEGDARPDVHVEPYLTEDGAEAESEAEVDGDSDSGGAGIREDASDDRGAGGVPSTAVASGITTATKDAENGTVAVEGGGGSREDKQDGTAAAEEEEQECKVNEDDGEEEGKKEEDGQGLKEDGEEHAVPVSTESPETIGGEAVVGYGNENGYGENRGRGRGGRGGGHEVRMGRGGRGDAYHRKKMNLKRKRSWSNADILSLLLDYSSSIATATSTATVTAIEAVFREYLNVFSKRDWDKSGGSATALARAGKSIALRYTDLRKRDCETVVMVSTLTVWRLKAKADGEKVDAAVKMEDVVVGGVGDNSTTRNVHVSVAEGFLDMSRWRRERGVTSSWDEVFVLSGAGLTLAELGERGLYVIHPRDRNFRLYAQSRNSEVEGALPPWRGPASPSPFGIQICGRGTARRSSWCQH